MNSPRININRKKDNLFAKVKSSKEIHALYIPVVKVDIPKKETDPKSDNVSIATNESPATIAGLAEGSIILKKDFCLEKPMFLPSYVIFLTENVLNCMLDNLRRSIFLFRPIFNS